MLSIETIGYIATALTLGSFLFTGMVKLRTVYLVGCLLWTAYALGLPEISYPVLAGN